MKSQTPKIQTFLYIVKSCRETFSSQGVNNLKNGEDVISIQMFKVWKIIQSKQLISTKYI